MRTVRPAAVIQADKDLDNAKQQLRDHAKQCGICAAAIRCHQPARCCDSGWAHQKYIRRMAAQLVAAETEIDAAASAQLALF